MKITQISMIALFSLVSAVAFAQHEHHPTETKTEPQTQDLGKLDKTVKKQLDNVLVTYFDLKDAFTETNAKKAAEKAGNFAKTLEKVETAKMTTAQQSFFAPLAKSMNTKAKYIAQLKEVEDQRLTFETVSGNILTLVKNLKFNDSPVYEQFCPMAFNNKGALWLSDEKEIVNPYFGNKMLHCGSVKAEF